MFFGGGGGEDATREMKKKRNRGVLTVQDDFRHIFLIVLEGKLYGLYLSIFPSNSNVL